jgi:hypothetical protein
VPRSSWVDFGNGGIGAGFVDDALQPPQRHW